MKLQWLGHSCFRITLENGKTIVTDPYDNSVGYPELHTPADIVLSSHDHFDHNYFAAIDGAHEVINRPGSYERFGARITGAHSWHDDAEGAKRGDNIIFSVEADGVKLVHLGDLGHDPDTDEQAAVLSNADVLLIPIGGTFTITTPQAIALIKRFKPAAAIAMHYKNKYCGFPVTDSAEFVRETRAQTLPNAVSLSGGALKGCYVMEI